MASMDTWTQVPKSVQGKHASHYHPQCVKGLLLPLSLE